MRGYETNHNKDGGTARKSAAVKTTGSDVIEVEHHIVNDEARVLHAYLGERSDGIDISIPLEQIDAVVRSDAGREALDIPVAEREHELVADGGRDIITPDDDERERWNEYCRRDTREQRLNKLQERADDAGDGLLTADDIKNGENLWLPGRTYPVPAIGVSFYDGDPGNDTDMDAVAEMHVADPGFTPLDGVDRCERCGDLTAGEMCSCDTDGNGDDKRLMTDGGREPESVKTIWPAGSGDEPWDNECGNPVCNYPIPDSDDFCGVRCGERVRAARALIERSESPESIIDEYRRATLDEARTVARALRPGADIEPHPSEYADEGPTCWSCGRELADAADDDATYCTNCLLRIAAFSPHKCDVGTCGRDGCDRLTQPGADYCQAEYCNSDEVVNDDDDDDDPVVMTDGGEPLDDDDDDVDTDFSGVDIEGAEDDDEVIVPGGGDDGEGIEEMSDDEADRMRADALAASAAAADDMDDDDDGDDGYVRNGDGLRVATGRGLDDMAAPGDDGKYSCVLCGAATDTEHGAKSHFGRSHKDATAIDVEQAIVMNDDDEVIVPDDDGGDDDGEGDEDMPEAWRNAANAYANARVQSSLTTRADARDAVVDALMSECDWMSIVERCEPGSHYDLWRWDDDDGWVDDADAYISERTAEYLKSTASDTEVGHYKSQLARRNYCGFNRDLLDIAGGV